MNAFDKALHGLKDTYPSPDPEREKAFIESLQEQSQPIRQTKRRTVFYALPACAAAAVMLIAGISLYQKMDPHRLPMIDTVETTTATVEEATLWADTTLKPDKEPTEPTNAMDAAIPAPSEPSPAVSTTDGRGSGAAGGTTCALPTQPITTVPQTVQTDAAPSTRPAVQTSPAPRATETQTPQQAPAQATETLEKSEETIPGTDALEEPEPAEPLDEPSSPADPADNEPEVMPDVPIHAEKDWRVAPKYVYQKGQNVISIKDLISESPIQPPDMDNSGGYGIKELADQSDLIVIGYVEQTYYTQADGLAYTQLDVQVQSVVKGKCGYNDRISVYEKGGYLPLDAAAKLDPFLLETGISADGIEYPGNGTQAGELRCFFLRHSSSRDIPDGAYIYAGSEAMSCVHQEKAVFYSADESMGITVNELWQLCT